MTVLYQNDFDSRMQNIIGETFKIYQDTAKLNIWSLMEGGKDEIYVFDRCGYLVRQMNIKESKLHFPHAKPNKYWSKEHPFVSNNVE